MRLSWQLRYLNKVLRHVVKPQLRKTGGPDDARKSLDFIAGMVFRKPPFLRHYVRDGGIHWFASGRCKTGKAILFFHGGGYVAGSPQVYSAMLGRLSRLAKVEICAPRYRLAQEASAPAAFEDALAAWDRLMAQGFYPRDIVLGGDSAGGGIAFALLAELCRRGQAPAAVFSMSPCVDFSQTGQSLEANKDCDVVLPAEQFGALAEAVLDGFDAADPRISPLFAEFPNCPPVLIHHSETEILRDDALRMADHLRSFGAEVTLQTLPDAPHVWHLMDGWVPEARRSLRQISQFSQDSLVDTNR